MSNFKGKGKATAEPTKETEAPAPSDMKNLINNVASSASGLARSAFAAPSSNELSNVSSSSFLGSGKGQASSSQADGISAPAESSKPTAQSSISVARQPHASQPVGFRTAPEHAQACEAEFSSFLDGIPSMETDISALDLGAATPTALPEFYQPQQSSFETQLSHTADDHPHPASRHVNPFLNEEFIRYSAHNSSSPLQRSHNDTQGHRTIEEAQAHDGADVLAILDTFKPEEMDYFEPQTVEQEVEDWKLTQEQYDLAKRLALELHITPSLDNPAQMVPMAFQDDEKAEYLPDEYSFDSHSHLGSFLRPDEAKDKWIQQWDTVLNSYQDEVWGGMAPLVKKAKEEIKEIVEGSESRQPKALARLGLVLGHISGARQQTEGQKSKDRERQREREIQRKNELMEAAETEAHNVPVNYGTWQPQYNDALRMEESARNSHVNTPQAIPSLPDDFKDPSLASNYGPQMYMQPEQAAQAQRYQTWFEKGFTDNERWRTDGQDNNDPLTAYKA